MKADLHMHSIYSDGYLTQEELFEEIKDAKLDVVALTDHDTIDGVEEMIELGKKNGIRVIPGLELTTRENDEAIHVLGYFKDVESISQSFKDYLHGMKEIRYNRLKKMTELVNNYYGFNIDFNKIALEHPNMLERPHLADEIIKITGETRQECFKKYIGNDSPCYIPAANITLRDGVKLIRDAGGIAILAHPYCYKKNDQIKLIEMGVDGVEVFYGPTSPKEYDKYLNYAKSHNLLITGGSDFHKFNDQKHSTIGTARYFSPYIEEFLERIEKL
ncbi:MAG: PHP domain-containing protein [Gammaproteobacteria bacterium]|nr:PHP domain-containing protein [Gammaproteobacteria bacterium]